MRIAKLAQTIGQWLKETQQQLAAVTDTADIEARLCLCQVLDVSNSYLYSYSDEVLTQSQSRQLADIVRRRLQNEPLAYIFGSWTFWDLPLKVAPCTLIPRADTECLVEQVLTLALPPKANVLDLGTGTGAIALALAHSRPDWHITATDKVADAVALAEENRQQLGLNNCQIIQSDWFSQLAGRQFQLIVSNPPYIEAEDPHLAALTYEPTSALIAPEHGLADIQAIVNKAGKFLTCGGWLWLEHGYNQAEAVQQLFHAAGFTHVQSKKDYGNNWRISGGCWPG